MQATFLRGSAFLAGLLFALPAVTLAQTAGDAKSENPISAPARAKTSAKSNSSAKVEDGSRAVSTNHEVPSVGLIDAMNKGLIDVSAEGSGDGRMTMSIKNKTHKSLNVVLPPGLVAQGATGQMGGMMGGMGGGMGGMGGGMMGGMGGMGGGMGGMGGMSGGMGGGMMGGGMGGGSGVMPASMGMMMLGRLIMTLIERDSWDMTSLMMGMGGMGMGGMGGGMGGMGGMGGGMGGGMRSVPPTGLPNATFKPGQTRELPTRLVSLAQPSANIGLNMPAKGEKLLIGDIGQINDNPRLQKALKRLAALKAPQAIAQLVLWKLNSDSDWENIAQLSKEWANAHELTLARDFVDHLDSVTNDETGTLLLEVAASQPTHRGDADEVQRVFQDRGLLGLKAVLGVPAAPDRPSVGCTVRLGESTAMVEVVASDGAARSWVPFGKFSLPVVREGGKLDVAKFSDALAEGILNRLVRAQLTKGPKSSGKNAYRLRIDNASPLVLNGLGILGTTAKADEPAKILPPLSLAPRRSVTMPASEAVVKHLELKKGSGGVRVVAADLSGL